MKPLICDDPMITGLEQFYKCMVDANGEASTKRWDLPQKGLWSYEEDGIGREECNETQRDSPHVGSKWRTSVPGGSVLLVEDRVSMRLVFIRQGNVRE